MDGVVSAAAVIAVVEAACLILSRPQLLCREWVFFAGLGLVGLSAVWSLAGYRSPPGLLGLLRQDVQIYPSSARRFWMDRFIDPRNVWVIAGIVCVAASFVLAVL